MFPLLAVQKSMFFYEKLNRNTPTYHHTIAMTITGQINVVHFINAIKTLCKRHEVMRSRIKENFDGIYLEPIPYEYYINHINSAIKFMVVEDGKLACKDDLSKTLNQLNQDCIIKQPFNFKTGPLWRNALIKTSKNEYQFYFVFHHMVMDIWSQNIILNDLSEIYNASIENRKFILPEISSLSSLQLLTTEKNEQKQICYWKKQLANLTTITFHGDFFPENAFRFLGERIFFHIESQTINACKTIAGNHQRTLNCFLLSTIFALLYRYTSETDICIGVVSANRQGYKQKIDHIVNCFVNSVPLRIQLDKDASFIELLINVSNTLKVALQQQLPLDVIMQKALTNETKTSTFIASPFSILCNFNKEKNTLNLLDATTSLPIELNLGHTKFERFAINFDMLPDGSCNAYIEFNNNFFKRKTIENLSQHLQIFCKALCINPDYKISQIPILTETEKYLLNKSHQNEKHTPANIFFHHLISSIAKANPIKNAVVFHTEQSSYEMITYAELEHCTDQLAAYLQNLGVGPEVTVGVSMTRSINLITTIIAILKAGGTVVPLDTVLDINIDFNSMLYYKLADACINIVIVDKETEHLFSTYKKYNKTFFVLNIQSPSYLKQTKQFDRKYVQPKLAPHNLAYIIYTSGTTGKPKGVMIEHIGLSNLALAILDRNLPIGSKLLCTAPPAFDCFFFEMLEWLCVAGELHIINEKQRLIPAIQEKIIRSFEINCATLLPDLIKNLNPAVLPSLYDVISMGAMPGKNTLDLWHEHGIQIRNEYGPTEATICITENPYTKGKSYVNIGKPIRNANIFILNKDFKECPIGVAGQLYISGKMLARGYVGNETLTKEKFLNLFYAANEHAFYTNCSLQVANKLQSIRLYATGDLACYVQEIDGSISIEFIGRTDRQIKIHGIRIELEGLEFLIQKHPLVKAIFIQPNAEKDGLIAYIVAKENNKITKSIIDHYLGQTSIPLAAWPKYIIQIPEMPITKNGKIDTQALPTPTQIVKQKANPQTPLQLQLCKIWHEVLNHNQINLEKTFREHGGDSLSLAVLENKILQKFPFIKHAKFNLLNKDTTILTLEKILKRLLPLKDTNNSTKTWCLAKETEETIQDQSPLFIFPGILGNKSELKNLVEHLHKRITGGREIYVYNDPRLGTEECNLIAEFSLEEQAKLAFNEMPTLPFTPFTFFIIGNSYGCLVAAQFANLLQQSGHNTHLFLIDGPSPLVAKEYLFRHPISATIDLTFILNYAAQLSALKKRQFLQEEIKLIAGKPFAKKFEFIFQSIINFQTETKDENLIQFDRFGRVVKQNLINFYAENKISSHLPKIHLLLTNETIAKYGFSSAYCGWDAHAKEVHLIKNADLANQTHVLLLSERNSNCDKIAKIILEVFKLC